MKHTTLLYSPSDFPMDSPATMAMADRMNGIFTPLEISPEQFKAAYELPIGEHVEKNYKGLSYLSWPFAFRYLKENFPALYVAFEEVTVGWPVFGQEGCWLLRPYLTDGLKRTPALVFPLMDNKHNALKELDARSVSDNIQRASVKCIATFTGLGLKLYAGEDIPKSDAPSPSPVARTTAPSQAGVTETVSQGSVSEESFNGKEAMLAFCKANPFQYADERASLLKGKAALESVGLSKGDDIKDKQMFANVVTTMVTTWTKENDVKITKTAMAKEIDTLRAICIEGSVEQAVQGVEVFVQGKQ